MRKSLFHFGTLLFVLLLSGCASIVSDNKSTTYLETDPEVCRCELHGQDFKRLVTTPNSIGLPSEAAPITIACTAPGYKRTTATLDTKMDGWIWANIVFGGVVGAVIDGARGSGFKYPPKFAMILEPEEFRTLDERDAWFDKRKTDLNTLWEAKIKRVKGQCATNSGTSGIGSEDGCKRLVADEEKKRDTELEQSEKARSAAKVAQVLNAAASPVMQGK